MHDQSKAKLRRLLIWFTINLIIFISCYLNYHLQLKHRYLYKTLSAGLCLSRAAAMVINFNLILVWIPMCKYTLTRLAVIACGYNQRQKIKLSYLISNSKRGESSSRQYSKTDPGHQNPEKGGAIFQIVPIGTAHNLIGDNHQRAFNSRQPPPDVSRLRNLGEKLKLLVIQAQFRISHAICSLTIKAINSFLIAVDHSTSLHTISATTITLASVIHTAAHLMNVINFSNNFDPLLSNLNMAEYKGQNPLQLLVSVPGITGCFMILILILMSLSSISAIRNSSFDLFQIFHRLSVLFVIFLILHPSSHVLKEQSNVDRHNPDICYDEMVKLRNVILASARATTNQTHDLSLVELVDADQLVLLGTTRATSSSEEKSTTSQPLLKATTGTNVSPISNAETRATSDLTMNKRSISISRRRESNEERVPAMSTPVGANAGYDDSDHHHHTIIIKLRQNNSIIANSHHSPSQADTSYHQSPVCQDIVPRFVAQSSICWYVLGAGLSCYLMDLILRRLRRNRNPIELLAARSDAEGNLIELTLSNNHERFAHWLPGQFVYLNCPQIATYEWHPFTISSMDNRTRQFTLHIKTGGDWTRKLRHELVKLRQEQEQQQQQLLQLQEGCYQVQPCNSGRNSMSLFSTRRNTYSIKHCCNFHFKGTAGYSDGGSGGKLAGQAVHQYPAIQYHSNLIHSGGSDYGDGGGKDLQGIRLTNFDCHDDHQAGLWWPSTTGQQQLRATQCSGRPPVHVAVRVDNDKSQRRAEGELELNDAVKIELDQRPTTANERRSDSICGWLWRGLKPSSSSSIVGTHQNQKLVNNSQAPNACKQMTKSDNAPKSSDKLHLFIDGPFHSPFERLLEQQVSICIANGVGWTAFSSVFQQIANKNNNRKLQPDDEDWWSQWRNYLATSKPKRTQHMKSTANSGYNDGDDGDNCTNAVTIPTLSSSAVHGSAEQKLSNDTKLHLMIIVTTIEQLKPFYSIVKKYFERLQLDCSFEGRGGETIYNPVREITAYITRSSRNDADVIEFCRQEGLLDAPNNNLDEVGGSSLLVNKSFAIKFGKPNFDTYLSEFSTLYEDKRKISIYCCGSYEVKRAVEKICQSLNKYPRSISGSKPVYCYHEENF